MCANQISTKEEVLAFWFDEISPEQWFKKDENFDAMLTNRAGAIVSKALNGQIDSWAETADGATALVIVLDQFTRNIFRDSPQAFSGDEMAMVVSLKSVNSKWFAELPNMHIAEGRVFKSTTTTYSAEEVDKKLAIKDKLIEKLSARLDKLEKRIK